jgi:fermentation-respiration switch protein FrsA (DUF1100 family)
MPYLLALLLFSALADVETGKVVSVILHSKADDVVPFADSEELVRNSGLPSESLIVVGHEHRLADPESLKAMVEAVDAAGEDGVR